MKMQFEAGNGVNILWGEDAEKKIVAEIDIIPGCSEDFGYMTMKKAIIERYPEETFDFWYDGQEEFLAADAWAPREVRVEEI